MSRSYGKSDRRKRTAAPTANEYRHREHRSRRASSNSSWQPSLGILWLAACCILTVCIRFASQVARPFCCILSPLQDYHVLLLHGSISKQLRAAVADAHKCETRVKLVGRSARVSAHTFRRTASSTHLVFISLAHDISLSSGVLNAAPATPMNRAANASTTICEHDTRISKP